MLLASATAVAATTTAPASAPATTAPAPPRITVFLPDLCADAVDPYRTGRQRDKFYKAAKVDLMLDQAEFAADAATKNGFVARFDRWDAMLRFDANGDRRMDWSEADAYRQAFRKKVLSLFDADRNGKLIREERNEANKALAAGKVSLDGPASQPAGSAGGSPFFSPEMARQYDADGDGALSESERQTAVAAWREQWRTRMLERYDADGDGQLSDDERRSAADAFANRTGEGAQAQDAEAQGRPGGAGDFQARIALQLFDRDGDGELSQDEQATADRFRRDITRTFEQLRRQAMDADGDGQVSDEERQTYMAHWRVAGMQWLAGARKEMDIDGDGNVSNDERRYYFRQARTSMESYAEKFVSPYDRDGDGRYSEQEIDSLMGGFRQDLTRRSHLSDADHNGRLDPNETISMMRKLIEEGKDGQD
jgi:Ca2+-binding EF-hand superfamily protein